MCRTGGIGGGDRLDVRRVSVHIGLGMGGDILVAGRVYVCVQDGEW